MIIENKNMSDEETLLKDQYKVDAELFSGIPIEQMCLKTRTANCLYGARYKTIKDVLCANWKNLHKIKGFGCLCRKDLEDALIRLLNNQNCAVESSKNKYCNFVSERVKNAIRQKKIQTLDRNSLSERELGTVLRYEKAVSVLGMDVTCILVDNPGYAATLMKILADYLNSQEREQYVYDIISRIDLQKLSVPLETALKCFHPDELAENILSEEVLDSCVTILDYIEKYSFQHRSNYIEKMFLKWCMTSAASLGNEFLQNMQKDERALEIVSQRARGKTLQEVGDIFGITRERIRQIEKKVIKAFSIWQKKIVLLA